MKKEKIIYLAKGSGSGRSKGSLGSMILQFDSLLWFMLQPATKVKANNLNKIVKKAAKTTKIRFFFFAFFGTVVCLISIIRSIHV